MPKGNKNARGLRGHKGGTGRPPKPEHERLRHHVSFFVNDALWDKINLATLDAGVGSYKDFLRRHLDESLGDACDTEDV